MEVPPPPPLPPVSSTLASPPKVSHVPRKMQWHADMGEGVWGYFRTTLGDFRGKPKAVPLWDMRDSNVVRISVVLLTSVDTRATFHCIDLEERGGRELTSLKV